MAGERIAVLASSDSKMRDNVALRFGDGAQGDRRGVGDVSVLWDGTNLLVRPDTDDTGILKFGNGTLDMDFRVTLGAAADYWEFDVGNKALELVGDARLDLSGATVAAANTDGGVIKAGTAAAKVTEDTADVKFVSLYWDCGAVSGDARGIYNRLYITGTGGGGESLRSFTTVEDVAGATAHGAHISLSLGATGRLTGQGLAGRFTLHMPTSALPASNVTYGALQAEIYSDGAAADPSGNLLSALRVLNDGNATGMADVDDDCAAFEFTGWTDATGNMVYGRTVRVRVAGASQYLLLSGSENRLDLSSINPDAGNTDGGVIKIGTSVAPVTEDTANMKFVSMYFDDGAVSGEAVGIYDRLYVTGAGGEGIALRAFCSVTDVAAGNARGAHVSLSFGATGSVTGLGTALETTLHIPSGGGLAGTVSSIKAAINSDGVASDPAGSRLSVFNVVNQGDATGAADVDDDAALVDFQGWTIGDGNMIAVDGSPGAMPSATHSFRCRLPDGSAVYLYGGATPVTA